MNASQDIAPDVDPLRDPALYFNRELSQLGFNFRVLAQARDPQVPLLERRTAPATHRSRRTHPPARCMERAADALAARVLPR